MNYLPHYERLIERAKTRQIEGYKERHHIIPRCMGGSDDPDNLVDLTAREHFIAHLLLAKMHPTNHAIVHAAKILMGSCNYNNRQFEWVRKLAVETSRTFHTGRKRSPQTCERISKAVKGKTKGRKISEEERRNRSIALTGRVFSEEHKKKLSEREITSEWRKKLSESQKGVPLSPEAANKARNSLSDPQVKEKHRLKMKEIASVKHKCSHCGKEVDMKNFSRWHGDKCKYRSL